MTFAQYKFTQKLGRLATINLPDTPKVKSTKGSELYLTRYRNVIFVAQVGNVQSGLRDLFNTDNVDSIYSGYITGTVKSFNRGMLFYKDKVKINGHDGIQFGYKGMLGSQQTYHYQKALYLNDTILMCGIWSSDSLSKDDVALKPFFSGFKVKTAEQLSLIHTRDIATKTGAIFGLILALCLPVLLGFAIVFIIKKIAYKKTI